MAELIPGAIPTPENDSKTVQVPSVKKDHLLHVSIEDLYDTSDDYANWVHFGVGGPA
jgi:hypothetical protein|tara:strand:+ start:1864 stop:2034 length:171 start_codon:yes stop_codon:yes gene_type:complete